MLVKMVNKRRAQNPDLPPLADKEILPSSAPVKRKTTDSQTAIGCFCDAIIKSIHTTNFSKSIHSFRSADRRIPWR